MDFIKVPITFALLFFVFSYTAAADEVLDSLEKAGKLYRQGSYSQAVSELQFAIGLIKDRQVDRYRVVLPGPPPGWTGEEPQVNRGTGLGLAGVTVSRVYQGPKGQSVTVEMVIDSPLVSWLAMILENPVFMGNNRLVTINGEKGIEEWNKATGNGKLQVIIQKRMLVTISGSNLKSKDVMYDFGKRIDFHKVRKMLQE